MSSASKSIPHRTRTTRPLQHDLGAQIRPIESSLPFVLFMMFVATFYLRLSVRIPGISSLRPELLLAALILATLAPYISQRLDLMRLPATKALNLVVLWIIVSLPFVEWPGSVIRENWFPFVKVILFFYFTIFVVDTPNRLRLFVWLFVGCQLFRVLEPLYLNLTSGYMGSATHLGGGEFADRLSGAPRDVINANGLGFVIVTATIFIHFLLWQSRSKALKSIYLVLAPAMLYALILTMSRGAFIALLVGGWLIFRQSRYKAGIIVAAAAIAIMGWSVMTDVQRDRYVSLISSDSAQSGSREGRIRGMVNEFKLGLNRPVFGHGLGTTPEAKVNVAGSRARASHNLYAELLIEIGLVGMILFLRFLWQVYRLVRENLGRHAVRGAEEWDFFARLNRALVVIFWVYAVYSINYFGLNQEYWYVFCGMCVAYGFITQRTHNAAAPPGSHSMRAGLARQ